jgi:hypothetical protein
MRPSPVDTPGGDCGILFGTKWSLDQQTKRSHLQQRDHCCPLCEKRFYNKHDLSKHVQGQHERVYKHDLSKHVQGQHERVYDYSCSKCNRGFVIKAHGIRHENGCSGLKFCSEGERMIAE